jgi:hypothetical protein
VHVLLTQAGWPWGSVVTQTRPASAAEQPPQFMAVLVVSTQTPPQSVGLVSGQPDPHAAPPAPSTHTGVDEFGSQELPHEPQFSLVLGVVVQPPSPSAQ